jgi:DNA processing protein
MKINQISPLKHKYLQIVSDIAKCPTTLYYIGSLPEQRIPTIAIVGTRKPTAYGRDVTSQFAAELGAAGIVIVSGLALGVDAIAHKACLDAGGTTIAVLPSSLTKIYPATNRDLAIAILQKGGALLSEYSEEAINAFKGNFLARNRIVAGISDAILITEASARSGTLNTAMHALEQGKDVFVIPGNITSPQSAGCNLLIRQGAIPVQTPVDIIERLAPELKTKRLLVASTPEEAAILDALNEGTLSADEIVAVTKLDMSTINTALTMLEIAGSIVAVGNNTWRRC